MIRRELKNNFKSFLIWTTILVAMFLIVFLIYPYIITDENIKNLDEMMNSFPKELLKAFNMDITSINTAYGWLKSEGFTLILLIIGFYSSILGFNIVSKEENDKTIEYLGTLPITRNKILTNKIIVAITYILGLILIIGIFNYIALSISGNFNEKQYILLSITPIFIGLPLFAINLFLSTFFHKTKKIIGISLGIPFIFYVLNILSEISTNTKFLKYFSIYTLADTRNVITSIAINPSNIAISITITLIFITTTYIKYNKKELL